VSTEELKAVARRQFEELWLKGNLALADELYAPDVVVRHPAPGQAPGREGLTQAIALIRQAFRLEGEIEGMVAEGDTVVRWETFRGTHVGDFLGRPATNRPFTLRAVDVLRIVDGRIVEVVWHQEDTLGLLQQLGALPAPGAGAG
jgi:steroid delta-isomerase-like uncharacterized protein